MIWCRISRRIRGKAGTVGEWRSRRLVREKRSISRLNGDGGVHTFWGTCFELGEKGGKKDRFPTLRVSHTKATAWLLGCRDQIWPPNLLQAHRLVLRSVLRSQSRPFHKVPPAKCVLLLLGKRMSCIEPFWRGFMRRRNYMLTNHKSILACALNRLEFFAWSWSRRRRMMHAWKLGGLKRLSTYYFLPPGYFVEHIGGAPSVGIEECSGEANVMFVELPKYHYGLIR